MTLTPLIAGKAEFWLAMQASYDLFQLRQARSAA